MRIIEKKIWSQWWDKSTGPDKTFELRLADFDCKEGDVLLLKEWDPVSKSYTGRQRRFTITHLTNTKSMETLHSKADIEKYGLYAMSIRPLSDASSLKQTE